jgi:hypothetical protein
MLFVEAPQSVAEIERIAKEADAPLLFNVVPGASHPGSATRTSLGWGSGWRSTPEQCWRPSPTLRCTR